MDETELLLAAGCRRTAGPAKAWNVLRVKTADDATLRLPVDDLRRTTVGGVKRLIEARGGVAPARQRLFFGGRELADASTVAQTRAEHGCTLLLVVRADPAPDEEAGVARVARGADGPKAAPASPPARTVASAAPIESWCSPSACVLS